jgi:hypothetical protein
MLNFPLPSIADLPSPHVIELTRGALHSRTKLLVGTSMFVLKFCPMRDDHAVRERE